MVAREMGYQAFTVLKCSTKWGLTILMYCFDSRNCAAEQCKSRRHVSRIGSMSIRLALDV